MRAEIALQEGSTHELSAIRIVSHGTGQAAQICVVPWIPIG